MAQNKIDNSKYKELDAILEKLPAYQEYKELNNDVNGNDYNNICKDFVTKKDEVETLCKKFLRNIDNLASQKGTNDYKSKYFYLSHWIVDELGKIFNTNSVKGARQTIDKIIYQGNIKYSNKNDNKNKIYFIYNSDFDFKVAKEEKYLHDYFINYDDIAKCTKEKCKIYAKFVEYITTIYYEHKQDCLGWPCDYFIHDPKYDPDDLLFNLQGKINPGGATRNNRGIEMSSEQLGNAESSNPDKSMIIKYINCFKIKDVDGKFLGYHCEDPAYSRHKKKVLNRKKVEQKSTYETVKEALEKTNYPNCTKVYGNNNEFFRLDCNNTKSEQSLTGVGLEAKQSAKLKSQGKPEKLENSDWHTEIFADSKANNDNSLESGNIMRGVKLVSVYRDITKNEKELDKMETQLISENGGTNLISTLFPEVPNEYKKKYKDKDKDILNCKIYGREHNKLICKKTIPKNYDEIANEQESPTNGINEIIDEIEDEPDFTIPVDNIFDIFKSKIFRNIVTAALTLGMFIVIFIYYKVYKNYILIYLY
ncbi:hypothetical protein PVNG_00558 [Plasmodium vivax North Korean]|uniref:Uncharacterized protein n=1 Tax=Plasmodium vivax North Korean TaxID=1035514 RepID=A0A0J9TT82_PLAVI|nr:hypothetical protein PVNG_00558 [Plasmodium vivax North Korean]